MPSNLEIRPVNASDKDRLLAWRNDPWIASLGSQKRTVSPEEHHLWFSKALQDEDVKIYIVELDGEACGQVRFNRKDHNSCEISVYLLREYTGKGMGVTAIRKACSALAGAWGSVVVVAHTLCDNKASQSAFHKAGFSKVPPDDMLFKQGHLSFYLRMDL